MRHYKEEIIMQIIEQKCLNYLHTQRTCAGEVAFEDGEFLAENITAFCVWKSLPCTETTDADFSVYI